MPTLLPTSRRRPLWVAATVLLVVAVAGCAPSARRGEADCGVYPLALQQRQPLTRGEVVTISSRGYRCGDGTVSGTESLYFAKPQDSRELLGSTQVASDGAFQLSVRIPMDAPATLGSLVAAGPTRQICAGAAATCARYGIDVTISN